jgi:putative tryptophan/tyrosine transport system substrate-binding protein
MRRRQFIAGLGSAAAWPFAARAQQPVVPVVGLLVGGSADASAGLVAAFRQGLSEAGYVEGRNVVIEYRWVRGQYDRVPALVAELVRRQVTVIATLGSTPATLAAKAATQTIPIVFGMGGDPVELGLVKGLNRPGGNLTGVTFFYSEVAAKRLELLHKVLPSVDLIAILVNPANRTSEVQAREQQIAAHDLGVRLLILKASSQSDIEAAFATLLRERAGALVVDSDGLFYTQRDQFVALAAHHALPAIYPWRDAATAGGLMVYASNEEDAWRLAGVYTGRILKGEKPADLPVMQPTKFEFVINLKTAKALGLTIPETLLASADQVIE